MEDDEIIIGITPRDDSNKNKKKKSKSNSKKKSTKTSNSKSNKKVSTSNSKTEVNKSKNNKISKKEATRRKLLKIIGIIILLIFLIILLCSSRLFNIKSIEVSGNTKLSDEKIISLSSLELYTNIFNFKRGNIVKNIKENAYIEDVKVSRKYPSTVNIEVEEREARYMLQFADSYVYINNQGYMLEISNEKLELPILVGFTTDLSNIKAGNRINVDDLKKLNTVIKIYDSAKLNDMNELITKIDISNSKNYSIEMASKGKIVYLGECLNYSDLKTRMLYLKSILDKTEGSSGEIFLDIDLNSEKIRFKEKVG